MSRPIRHRPQLPLYIYSWQYGDELLPLPYRPRHARAVTILNPQLQVRLKRQVLTRRTGYARPVPAHLTAPLTAHEKAVSS